MCLIESTTAWLFHELRIYEQFIFIYLNRKRKEKKRRRKRKIFNIIEILPLYSQTLAPQWQHHSHLLSWFPNEPSDKTQCPLWHQQWNHQTLLQWQLLLSLHKPISVISTTLKILNKRKPTEMKSGWADSYDGYRVS